MNMKKSRMPKMDSSMRPEGMAMPRFGARAMRPGGMAKGGKIHEDAAMDKKLIRKEIARAEKMEHKSEKKEMKKGGAVKKMAVGGMAAPSGAKRPPPVGSTRPFGAGGPPAQAIDRPRPVGGTRPSGGSMSLGTAGGPGGGRPAGMLPRAEDRAPGGASRSTMGPGSMGPGGGRPIPGFKKGDPVGKMARGGGVERKGKTKGKFI